MSIFRAYDIRGIHPTEIHVDNAYLIGMAYSQFLKPKKVVIGMDLRKSSKAIHDAFVKGLRDSGVDVTSIGACTSPMLYFAGSHYGFDGAVMVTASHLPGHFNGLKLCREHAIALSGPTGIYQIEKMVQYPLFPIVKKKGKLTKKSIKKDYHHYLRRLAKKTKLKIIVDCGNGMGYLDTQLLRKIADVTTLYEKPNMTFPNHVADPNHKTSHVTIMKLMKRKRFDLGIIFDGDCDRVGFVDEKGKFVPKDHVAGMLADYLLSKKEYQNKKQKIILDVRSGLVVHELIKKHKGTVLLSKAGHSFFQQKMFKTNALFAGEKSGHYFFRSFHSTDNAVLAVIKMLNHLHESKKPCSELAAPFEKYFQIPREVQGTKPAI
ncbi:hypothetical protein ACFL96_18955 [Thermoproteota archaeon]